MAYKRSIYVPFTDLETAETFDFREDAELNILHDDDPILDQTEKTGSHHLEFEDAAEMEKKMSNKWWRLCNLYYIIDQHGDKVLFKPNYSQWMFYNNLWYSNIILKARQLGFTTFIDLYILDECLFNSNLEAGIIAHNREDAAKILRRKVLYPYNNLPDWVKDQRQLITQSKHEIEFRHSDKDSSILSVSTSYRSGTCHLLHISEFGKICAKYPQKAEEIVSGAFEAIHMENRKNLIFIESTAEGREGFFFEYCKIAQDMQLRNTRLSPLDYQFHFFPWYENPGNSLSTARPITDRMNNYFRRMEVEIGEKLRPEQKYWYVAKEEKLGELMKREHPFTPKEAFEQAIIGAYFASQFTKIREEGRIGKVPHTPGVVVDTWWDLGIGDAMSIWFSQDVDRQIHMINYYENSGEGIEFYANKLTEFRLKHEYNYGTHNGPHDVSKREIGPGHSIWISAAKVGINFRRIPRVQFKRDSINAARIILNLCCFDEEMCDIGIKRLENYKKEWNTLLQTFRETPLHDINSNGSDAFQTMGMGHKFKMALSSRIVSGIVKRSNPKGWT